MSMCMPCMVCIHVRSMFLAKHGFLPRLFHEHWLKVEPKQSTLFFKAHISFSIIEEEVVHAIDTLGGEAILAWQTWEVCVCRYGCACMCGACFFRNMDSNLVWFMAHWPRVEPKQSTFFFKTCILFLIEEDVEHAKCLSMEDEAIDTWQTLSLIHIWRCRRRG